MKKQSTDRLFKLMPLLEAYKEFCPTVKKTISMLHRGISPYAVIQHLTLELRNCEADIPESKRFNAGVVKIFATIESATRREHMQAVEGMINNLEKQFPGHRTTIQQLFILMSNKANLFEHDGI